MYSVIRVNIFLLLFFWAAIATSQDDDGTDSLEAPPETVKTTGSRFLSLNKADPVQPRNVPDEEINRLKNDEAYWYANVEPEKKKLPDKTGGLLGQAWFKTMLWLIILVSFLAAVAGYLAASNVQLFRKESKKLEGEEVQDFAADIFSVNYDREIGKAVEAKNYRVAVRLRYLQILKELADRNLIDYRHEKTNSEYLAQLFNGRYHRDFFRVTRNFEYIWYGQFPLSEDGYHRMQNDFVSFKNGLGS